jgi:predicted permease
MLARAWRRIRLLGRQQRFGGDVRRELDAHLAMEIEHRIRQGAAPDEARRTALRDFGGITRIHEEVFDVRGITFWDTLWQDLKFGGRTLVRSPGYTAAAMLVLALGIGVNTAMFSVMRGVLFEPLPFRDGGELVLVQQSARIANVADAGVSIQELADYRARLQSIRDLVEFHSMSFVLLNQGDPDRIQAAVVSANFFDMLGIRPLLGRTFVDEDDDIGAEAVLVLSHDYWKTKFGGDESVVGRVLEMNNRPHTVVGVLPAFPQYPVESDVYMSTSACPFRAQSETSPSPIAGHRSFAALRVFGRLAPGATVERAAAEVATVAEGFNQPYAGEHERTGSQGLTGRAASLQDQLTTDSRPLLYALTAATALVLLLACANLANLALARTLRRSREIALRTALGAGRARILRQLVTESLIVAVAGGALGLGLAYLTLDLLIDFVGRFTTRTGQIDIDAGVLGFALLASVVTGLVFGAAPALAARRNLTASMRDGGAQAGDGVGRNRLRSALVVAQVAVSFVLLVGAALLIESLYRLSAVPLGYQSDGVITAAYFGNFSRMQTPEEAHRVQASILETLRSTPGIRAAALTNAVPQVSATPGQTPFAIEGRTPRDGVRLEADPNISSDGYFDLLGVRLLAGRDFRRSDTLTAPQVAIINAAMAAYWEGADPIGSRFLVGSPGNQLALTVVGVVGNFRLHGAADREVEAQFYRPATQFRGPAGRLLVRTDGAASESGPTIRAAVHAADPQLPVEELQTLDQLRDSRLTTPGVTTALLAIFALAALAITLAGLAGLIGTSVSQRTREFGLRMALGASRLSVLRLVLGQGAVLVVTGVMLGIAGAYWFSQLIARFLFGTPPVDPVAYAGVALVFLVAALLATFGPARRATTTDPLTALRTE